MKIKDIKELHGKTEDELLKILADLKEEIKKENIDLSMNKLKNTSLIKNQKKDIARVLTILGEKKSELTYGLPSGKAGMAVVKNSRSEKGKD